MPEQALALLACGLQEQLGDNFLSLYLYGSAAMGDFRPGWSDLDLLCLTRSPLFPAQADALLPLRQSLAEANPAVSFLRCAEGAVLSLAECRSSRCVRAVVWGSRGERLSNGWSPDAFTLLSLHQCGRLLAGKEVRASLPCPDADTLRHALTLRRNPALARLPEEQVFLAELGPVIQRFADVLEAALNGAPPTGKIPRGASCAPSRKGV